ncbi:hypothetical protein ACMGDM_08280 [Sphingomonas sp. DT-51]
MLPSAQPEREDCSALVPVRGDVAPRRFRPFQVIAAAAALVGVAVAMTGGASGVTALAAGASVIALAIDRRLARAQAEALGARLIAERAPALVHAWAGHAPGAIGVETGPIISQIDRSTAYQTVTLLPAQIVAVTVQHGLFAHRILLRYRLDPSEVARRALIGFGRDRAAATALAAHLDPR